MRRLLAVTAVLLTGCGGPSGAPREAVPVNAAAPATPAPAASVPAPAPTVSVAARRPRSLTPASLVAFARSRPGRSSVVVHDLKTGDTVAYRQHDRYITASVMKVNILIGLLIQKRDVPWGTAGRMIRESDNTAADELYRLAGRGPGLTKIDRTLGLAHTVPFPTVWGASQTDPADQVELLKTLTADGPLTRPQRTKVLHLMETVIPEQRWGVKAAARPGERVANKNGWTPMRFQGHGWAVHTIGRITSPSHDFLVAAFSAEQPSLNSGITTIEGLTRRAVTTLR